MAVSSSNGQLTAKRVPAWKRIGLKLKNAPETNEASAAPDSVLPPSEHVELKTSSKSKKRSLADSEDSPKPRKKRLSTSDKIHSRKESADTDRNSSNNYKDLTSSQVSAPRAEDSNEPVSPSKSIRSNLKAQS